MSDRMGQWLLFGLLGLGAFGALREIRKVKRVRREAPGFAPVERLNGRTEFEAVLPIPSELPSRLDQLAEGQLTTHKFWLQHEHDWELLQSLCAYASQQEIPAWLVHVRLLQVHGSAYFSKQRVEQLAAHLQRYPKSLVIIEGLAALLQRLESAETAEDRELRDLIVGLLATLPETSLFLSVCKDSDAALGAFSTNVVNF